MVLESLINPQKVNGKRWEMFFIGIIYSLIGAFLGFWVFKSHVSLVMVSFTAIVSVPFIHKSIELEDARNKRKKELFRFKQHSKLISMFTFLFLGFVVTFVMLFVLLPETYVGQMFDSQIDTINNVKNVTTGSFSNYLGSFSTIIINNLQVLFFCIIFSFFYGAGAIFILSWNASVMGAAIGGVIRQGLSIGSGLHLIPIGFLSYFMHGIPEIVAYLVAGLAGGIVSVAIIKDQFMSNAFKKSCFDSLLLVLVAVGVLIFAALIEIFISPMLF